MTIAIVGAGIAGLAAAQALAARGRSVRLFDKGRGAGGRMATRRASVHGAEVSFDHGAQYFTARSAAFREAVAGWRDKGVVAGWDDEEAEGRPSERFVGVPGMSRILKSMAALLDVTWDAKVMALGGGPGRWTLRFVEGADAGPFETVIVAVPAEQAAGLLAPVSAELAANAGRVRSEPCWAVMLAYTQRTGMVCRSFEPAEGPLGWTARNSSKAGRAGPEAWVIQARPDWSRANLEAAPERVAQVLAEAFREQTGAAAPEFALAHRWRYARVAEPLGVPFQFDAAAGLATCGDWHLGARVEAAWTSGRLLSAELLR